MKEKDFDAHSESDKASCLEYILFGVSALWSFFISTALILHYTGILRLIENLIYHILRR